ncbi:MAG: hypothetical protein H7Z16_04060 [Pyrinomonadaceae bacterium]|nr:hypothetical protein [Pyrinomonadaceae bacterium]
MSNKLIFFTQIAQVIIVIGSLFGFFRLMVQQIVQQKDATIELLRERATGLEKQLDSAKTTTSDALLDRYYRKIGMLESELSKLDADDQTSRRLIEEKHREITTLNAGIEVLRDVMEEYAEKASRVDECPYCEASLLSVGQVDYADEHAIVTHKTYSCGYSEGDGFPRSSCPNGPPLVRVEPKAMDDSDSLQN